MHIATPPHLPTLSRRRWLLTALASAGLAACGGGHADEGTPTPSTDPALTAAAQAAVAQGLVGVTLGLVEPEKIRLSSAGLRRQSGAALQTSDALYFGSNAKAMTAMTLARLVELGTLRWDLTLTQALGTVPGMRAEYGPVTLQQLLDHQGGILAMNGTSDDEDRFMAALLADPNPLPSTVQGRRRYTAQWLLGQTPPTGVTPGRDFHYSNGGYMLAAVMAEAATGLDFEVLLRQHFVQPLGLNLHTLKLSQLDADQPWGYTGLPQALTEEVLPDALTEDWLYTLAPAGDYACTGDSYARWLHTLMRALRGGNTPLPASAVARLRALPADGYALGWQALTLNGKRVLAHTGSTGSFMSLAVLDPNGQWAAFGLTNTGYMDAATGASWVQTLLNEALAPFTQSWLDRL